MLAPDFFQNAQRGRVISAHEMHYRNATVGHCCPKSHAVPLAMLFRYLEALHGLVEPVHIGKHVSATQADGRNSIVVRVL